MRFTERLAALPSPPERDRAFTFSAPHRARKQAVTLASPPTRELHGLGRQIRPTRVEIDLAAVRENVAALATVVAPARIIAVVKADAYGHGAVPVARALAATPVVQAGALAVSLLEEALELREHDVRGRILVLGGFYGEHHVDVVSHDLEAVVFTAHDLARFAAVARAAGRRVRVHLKVDTGMSRLGLPHPDDDGGAALDAALKLLTEHPELELTGLLTHLAEADGADPASASAQLARFVPVCARVHAAGFSPELHAGNSAAALRFPAARLDAVRPGLALYGIPPEPDVVPATTPALRPAMRFVTEVIALRDIPAGRHVSYDGLFEERRPTRIAVLPVGYADGYPRRLSGRGEILIGGQRCPVAGAVCMDMTMVDVTDLPVSPQPGDEAVLLGAQGAAAAVTARELAERAELSPYEIPCLLSKRVPRLYLPAPGAEEAPDRSAPAARGPI